MLRAQTALCAHEFAQSMCSTSLTYHCHLTLSSRHPDQGNSMSCPVGQGWASDRRMKRGLTLNNDCLYLILGIFESENLGAKIHALKGPYKGLLFLTASL